MDVTFCRVGLWSAPRAVGYLRAGMGFLYGGRGERAMARRAIGPHLWEATYSHPEPGAHCS